MHLNLVLDIVVFQKLVRFFTELDGHFAVFTTYLIVVTVSPEDAYAAKVLTFVKSTSHMRARKISQTA